MRPYWYRQAQKNENEKLVNDILATGIVRPSMNPFSSPIILVKKDGSCRFCVDYRALKRTTTPDKFSILIINKLMQVRDIKSVFLWSVF